MDIYAPSTSNAEIINRLVEQGQLLLKTFHAEYEKDAAGVKAEFARGELTGWRSTLHALYQDYGEDIVNRGVTRTRLGIPDGEVPSGNHSCHLRQSSTKLSILITASGRLA
jgi:hypothetical protein